jgi:hypothetical protein
LVAFEFAARVGERYALTPESSTFLVSTKPAFCGALLRHSAEQVLPNWMQLSEVVRTGRPARAANLEQEGSEFFGQVVEALFPMSYPAALKLGEHLELSKCTRPFSVLDLAAGSGVWGIALATLSPHVIIRAVDWTGVLKITAKVAAQHNVAERIALAPGDLLEADLGSGHQAATLGHIIHSEGAERTKRLLGRTFDALAPGGTIAIMEFLPNDERTGPPQALIFAVSTLVSTEHGDTFTFGEIS